MTVSTNGNSWYGPCQASAMCWNAGFTDGQYILMGQGSTSLSFTFSSAVSGFATQAWDNLRGGSVQLTAWRGGVQTAQHVFTTGGSFAPNNNQATTLGIVDASGFDRVDLAFGSEVAVNDLTLGGAPATPEPASMTLLGSGLLGRGILARRRRRAKLG